MQRPGGRQVPAVFRNQCSRASRAESSSGGARGHRYQGPSSEVSGTGGCGAEHDRLSCWFSENHSVQLAGVAGLMVAVTTTQQRCQWLGTG